MTNTICHTVSTTANSLSDYPSSCSSRIYIHATAAAIRVGLVVQYILLLLHPSVSI